MDGVFDASELCCLCGGGSHFIAGVSDFTPSGEGGLVDSSTCIDTNDGLTDENGNECAFYSSLQEVCGFMDGN